MDRYAAGARWYDALSGEVIYRPARLAAIGQLRLAPNSRVLDVGCGTGLNFGPLLTAMKSGGQVVGLDRSPEMAAVAQEKATVWSPDAVRLVVADAQTAGSSPLRDELLDGGELFDAALFTYTLSLMPQWQLAWRGALGLVRAGGRVAVVDLHTTRGLARPFAPLARGACWAGGSDINARPWTAVESETDDVFAADLRGGHVQVRVGTVRH